MTPTTTRRANANLTVTTEPSINSVNISLYDLSNSKLIVNNELNLDRLNRIVTRLLNQTPSDGEETMTNTEPLPIDLTTVENKNIDIPTNDWNTDYPSTEQSESSTIAMDASTAFDIETTAPTPIETTLKQSVLDPIITTPIPYVPRFVNRIAILPIGFYSSATMKNKVENTFTPSPLAAITKDPNQVGKTPSITIPTVATTTQALSAMKENNQITTASPYQRSPTPRKNRRFDFVVYGILANNTVIRRYPEDIYENGDDNSGEKAIPVIYGILSNNTVLRKYPNGTTEIDEKRSSRAFEITDIDPMSLFNPNSAVYTEPTPSIDHQTVSSIPDDANLNNQSFSTNKSTFNLNNTNTSTASSSSNYNNANSTTAPPTVFNLPIIIVYVFNVLRGKSVNYLHVYGNRRHVLQTVSTSCSAFSLLLCLC